MSPRRTPAALRSHAAPPSLRAAAALCLLVAAFLGACARHNVVAFRSDHHTTELASPAAPQATGMLHKSLTLAGREHKYLLYIPRGWDGAKPMPLIVFLHGRGECGTDGSRQGAVGIGPAALLDPEQYPALILMPQKPEQATQWVDHEALVLAAIETTQAHHAIDPDRISLTGLSQGGAGTWAIAARHPGLFSAIAPVCGYGDPALVAPAIKHLPIWALHGLKDNVVPAAQTERMAEALRAQGASPTITLYPDANHNAWDPAYRGEKLGLWLVSHRRNAK